MSDEPLLASRCRHQKRNRKVGFNLPQQNKKGPSFGLDGVQSCHRSVTFSKEIGSGASLQPKNLFYHVIIIYLLLVN